MCLSMRVHKVAVLFQVQFVDFAVIMILLFEKVMYYKYPTSKCCFNFIYFLKKRPSGNNLVACLDNPARLTGFCIETV